MTECNHNCEGCAADCAQRQTKLQSNTGAKIRNVVAVVSGKGGVGKSMVTSLLAAAVRRQGYNTAVLDADITGPSIPHCFGLHTNAYGVKQGIVPVTTTTGIKVMSINLLSQHDTDPVLWRGPVIANAVKQFYQDVLWQDVDYMFVDMPPGTGDVPLTVFQSLPLQGIVVVTTPQDLVAMIVEKAVNMANKMNVPVIGIVENMSYWICPDCNTRHNIFGQSHVDEIAKKFDIPVVAKLPINSQLQYMADNGQLEMIEQPELKPVVDTIVKSK